MYRVWCAQENALSTDVLPVNPLAPSPETVKTCANQPYVCKELVFQLQTRGKDNIAKVIYDKQSISFKLTKLNYLLSMIAILENQLARYSFGQHDVMTYITNALGSDVFVQPLPDSSTFLLYDQLFDYLKVIM